MRRWLAALIVSLLIHSSLLLIPHAPSTGEEPVKSIRVTLRSNRGSSKGQENTKKDKGTIKKENRKKSETMKAARPPVEKKRVKKTIKKKTYKKKTAKKTIAKKAPSKSPEKKKTKKKTTVTEKKAQPQSTKESGQKKGQGKTSSSKALAFQGSDSQKTMTSRGKSSVLSEKDVTIVKKVRPSYPLVSRKRKEEGSVILLLNVKGGRVKKINIEKSSGYDRLDRAAIKALKKWRFDRSLSSTVRIPVIFSLKK